MCHIAGILAGITVSQIASTSIISADLNLLARYRIAMCILFWKEDCQFFFVACLYHPHEGLGLTNSNSGCARSGYTMNKCVMMSAT